MYAGRRCWTLSLALGLAACGHGAGPEPLAAPAPAGELSVVEDLDEAFDQALAQDRLVLLDLEASWCHWCHVMDARSYADPEVRATLAEGYVLLRLDVDANPVLAERYAAWGWPATVVFTPQAEELHAWRGFVEPEAFAMGLAELADAHRRGRSVVTRLSPPVEGSDESTQVLEDRVTAQLDRAWNEERGAWARQQMYPIASAMIFSLARAQLRPTAGEQLARAQRAFEAMSPLVDPVWGGVWQYSTGGVWTRPHFEKLALLQAELLEAHAYLLAASEEPGLREALWARSEGIVAYLDGHLRGEGGYGASQDADAKRRDGSRLEGAKFYARDAKARAAALEPARDLSVYADVNGSLVVAFARLARVAPPERAAAWRARALELAASIVKTHRDAAGGFSHAPSRGGESVRGLGDQVAMLCAFVELYELSGDRRWRSEAAALAEVLERDFVGPTGALMSSPADPDARGVLAQPRHPLELNGRAAHALLRLHRLFEHANGESSALQRRANEILQALGSEERLRPEGRFVGRFGLALLASDPGVWITVVGEADTPGIEAMQAVATRVAAQWPTALVDRSPPGEWYPGASAARAFICDETRCSAPVSDPTVLAARFERFVAAR